eukprot:g1894.t1
MSQPRLLPIITAASAGARYLLLLLGILITKESHAARAIVSTAQADYKWQVLVSTAVYGEDPETFNKRKQVEFLDALAHTLKLQWRWGTSTGGRPGGAARGQLQLHDVRVHSRAAIKTGADESIVATLHLASNSLTIVHECVTKLESERFAHDLSESFTELQYRKELLVKDAAITNTGHNSHQSQRADLTFEIYIVNERPGTFSTIKQHELLVCIATLLRVGYDFGGNLNDPYGGAPAVNIHFKMTTFAHLGKAMMKAVDASKFLRNLSPMIAPMMAVSAASAAPAAPVVSASAGRAGGAAGDAESGWFPSNYVVEHYECFTVAWSEFILRWLWDNEQRLWAAAAEQRRLEAAEEARLEAEREAARRAEEAAREARRMKEGLMPWLADGSSSDDEEEGTKGKKMNVSGLLHLVGGQKQGQGEGESAAPVKRVDEEEAMAKSVKAAQKAAHVGRGHWVDGHWVLEEYVEEKVGERKLRERRERKAKEQKKQEKRARRERERQQKQQKKT